MTISRRFAAWGIALTLSLGPFAIGQQPGRTVNPPSVAELAVDTDLDVAQELIGRALFLRGFYQGNSMSYDASGRVLGSPKTTDWTLAGIDIQKVERKGSGRIHLDGVRVAIRYNPDQHLFERHPQREERVQIALADSGDPKAFAEALRRIFATGIDLPLQLEMPEFWLHYFNPATPWPKDDLVGRPLLGVGGQALPPGATYAVAEKKVEPKFTGIALYDHVKGQSQLRMVVDTAGVPRRIAILQPLGYGLDERVVEAVRQWRFRPGMYKGQAVASVAVVDQTFEYVSPPAPR